MYLKRVELAGFKSFADRTELEIVPGITAVVGPNGSGKSNITDAIRWVLGEQSAKSLRGTKMEDIIFAGSDSRKPVNFAEVVLTLDNQDKSLDIEYSEVTITRRLYRSGESDYFINNQSCRLKDIVELLMDTGIGREAYSIIGQGKIEEILSSKPEDRRGIFEEAAGIVKYKTRKREAKKKLEDTEHNLVRISDLISELQGQIDPLEVQAEKAKHYKEYADKLKELNIKIYVHDIEKTYEEWQQTDAAKKELANDQAELSSTVGQIDALIEQKRWHVNQLEKELEELHQKMIEISEKVEQAEGKKEVLIEREKNHHSNKAKTIEAMDKSMNKKAEILSNIEKEKEKLNDIEDKIKSLSEQLENEETTIENILATQENQIERYKQDYFELVNSMATLRNEIRHISDAKESNTYRIDKLKGELEEVEKEKENTATKISSFVIDKNTISIKIDDLSKEFKEIAASEKELLYSHDGLKQEIQQDQQKLNSMMSRYEVLMDMQADFSGFNQGVKEILKLRESERMDGIHGAVAELIHVPKDYETSIETALGGSLQYIVVDKEAVGRQAISFLKEHRLGRATFLPLDVIRSRRVSNHELNQIKNIKGFVGLAVDLIQTEQKYTSIVEFLLGQVIVAQDLKIANEIAKALGYSKRIVTLEGEVVNPGGSMTGGSIQRKNVGLLGRQREIDELSVIIEKQKLLLSDKQKKSSEQASQMQVYKERLEEIRIKGEQKRFEEQELQGKLKQLEYEDNNINQRISVIKQELADFMSQFNHSLEKEQNLMKDLEEKEGLEAELQTKIEQLEQRRKMDETTKQEMSQKITSLKIEIARLEQDRDASRLLVDRLSSDMNEIVSTIEQQQHSLIDLENELVHQQKNKEHVSNDIDSLRLSKDQLQREIEEKRQLRLRNVQEIESEEAGTKEARKNLRAVEAGLHQTEVKLNRLDVELENLLKKLTEEYEMSYEWAKQYVERLEDIEAAKTEVKDLKQSIQALGEVNLGAIEEFERVSERYNFLSSQKNDLVEAKETLYQVIQEVDQEMNKRFKESFDAIREQFQNVFTKLFGGGRADLILTEPDNLLDTGVEIVAQPPGKKLQNLALLSGGEKALTAITLLFAILRVKPVPFAILDEVEAALDEANVSRFAEYLREFCDQTQFIVVTHRKGTMEGADVLYGVTMQESGVSRLVSVKLEEKEKVIQLA